MFPSLLYIKPRGQDELTLRRARVLTLVLISIVTVMSVLLCLSTLLRDERVKIPLLAVVTTLSTFYLLNRQGRFQLTLNLFLIFQSVIPLIMGLNLAQPVPSIFFLPLTISTAALFGRPSDALRWAAACTFVPFLINLGLYHSLVAPITPLVFPNGVALPPLFVLEFISLGNLWATAGATYATSRLLYQIINERTCAEAALREAHDGLEQQVTNRTAELLQSNVLLQEQNAERARAQEALLRSEGNQRALLDAIPDLMFRVNQDGVILDFKAEKGTGVTVPWQANVGSTIAQVMPPDLAAQTMALIQRALQTNEVQISEYAIPAHNDIIDGEARVVVSGPNEIVTIIRNITERKNIERLKDEFISTVSHELRTPLTSIRGSLGLIAGGVTGTVSPQVKAMVEIAYNNSERLVRLINDMLDIAKIESGKMTFDLRPLAVIPLVEQALADNASYAAQFGVRLAATYADPDLTVEADSDRLLQVLTNLLSNAAKFSSAGATVDVGVARVAGHVRLTVRDYGAGIPEAFRERIFQKFAQADASNARNKGGTGLGLSITKVIVEKCGGTISFSTETGVGTTFTVDLPEWRPSAIADSNAPPFQPRILLCEADPLVETLLYDLLAQRGWQTDVARTAAEAKTLLGQYHYDTMTLDLDLPDQHGAALIRELRSQPQTRRLPIVVVSASIDHERVALNGDAFLLANWLTKPLDPGEVIAAVQHAILHAPDTKPHILHVEDDPGLRLIVETMLKREARVSPAASLQEARRLLRHGVYDLVILDVALPDGSGLDLLPLLHQHRDPIPVLIFSGYEMSRAIIDEVAAVLVKSRTSEQSLLTTIATLIERNRQAMLYRPALMP